MWFDASALIHSVNPSSPWSWNEISAIGRTDVKAALQQVENELEKCFWQASLTYYRVTFRYQIDGSRSWHWTSVLLITLLWVGSADRREPHHDSPIHSDRETWSTDRPSCIETVTSLNSEAKGYLSVQPAKSFEFTLVWKKKKASRIGTRVANLKSLKATNTKTKLASH